MRQDHAVQKEKKIEQVLADNLSELMQSHVQLKTLDAVAQRSGVGRGSVDRIRKAEISTSIENVAKLADAFHVEPAQLLAPGLRSHVGGAAVVRQNIIDIPKYDVAGSMGRGLKLPDNYVEVVTNMSVDLDYLRNKTTFTHPSNLALITAYGNSMADTFHDGDTLLVDRGVNEVKIEDVFVLALNDELYIKRVQRIPTDGSIRLISDNPKYPPITVTKEDRDKFQVLGRVLLAWNVNNKL